jgi:hypothetical protein
MNSVVSQQAKKEQRDISVGWVDYKKAFDSVPHSWLLRVLELYKIDPKVIQLLLGIADLRESNVGYILIFNYIEN